MIISDRQRAELSFAKKLGVIEKIDDGYILDLMNNENSKLNDASYGKTSFNETNFLRYFISKFRMKFVFMELDYDYKDISEEDIENYYEKHKIEFLREDNNYFPLEEIKLVVKKRLREIEYEEAINDLSH